MNKKSLSISKVTPQGASVTNSSQSDKVTDVTALRGRAVIVATKNPTASRGRWGLVPGLVRKHPGSSDSISVQPKSNQERQLGGGGPHPSCLLDADRRQRAPSINAPKKHSGPRKPL